jgi:hypothetical protein
MSKLPRLRWCEARPRLTFHRNKTGNARGQTRSSAMPAVSIQLNNFIMPSAPRASTSVPPARSWLARFTDAVVRIRDRRMERDVATYIQAHGARLTDDLERKIEHHFV